MLQNRQLIPDAAAIEQRLQSSCRSKEARTAFANCKTDRSYPMLEIATQGGAK